MEVLKLSEIVGYLPYGLKFISELDNPCKELGKHPVWTLNGITFLFSDYCLNTTESNDAYPIHLSKPILRPLSDLTKEIEHNEESFVPIKELKKIFYNVEFNDFIELNPFSINISMDSNSGICWGLDFDEIYGIVQKLYSWHFDIHNLIGRNLAIDINKL